MSEVIFLGHLISEEGIKVDPTKVEAVSSWERPKIVSEIRSFLGQAGYYRRFIKDFSSITLSLTTLTKQGVSFIWDRNCEASFNELKAHLNQ